MSRIGLGLAAMTFAGVMTACAVTEEPPPRPSDQPTAVWPAGYAGWGALDFRIDEAAFERAWNGELQSGVPARGTTCFYKRPLRRDVPDAASYMFEDGKFVRYDVTGVDYVAPGGGKVGMGATAILGMYPAVDVLPHKYEYGAKYLRVKAPSGDSVLVFETDAGGKVARWHVGVPPQVDYVEGCG